MGPLPVGLCSLMICTCRRSGRSVHLESKLCGIVSAGGVNMFSLTSWLWPRECSAPQCDKSPPVRVNDGLFTVTLINKITDYKLQQGIKLQQTDSGNTHHR